MNGSRVKPSPFALSDLPATILWATEYVLVGKRELIQRLRTEHDGHYDDVTGVVHVPPAPRNTDVKVRSKDIGKKTRVTIGERQDSSLVQATPQPVTITVSNRSGTSATAVHAIRPVFTKL